MPDPMNAEERISWLNQRDPCHIWRIGQQVHCLHCEGVFKAEDVATDSEGDPTCPHCLDSTPIDFHRKPWWRSRRLRNKSSGTKGCSI